MKSALSGRHERQKSFYLLYFYSSLIEMRVFFNQDSVNSKRSTESNSGKKNQTNCDVIITWKSKNDGNWKRKI